MKTKKTKKAVSKKTVVKTLQKIKIERKSLLIPLILLVLGAILYFGKGQLLVAMVNNQPIWRISLIRELEKQGGKQVLDSLITKALILQEAKKQKVLVAESEINKEIAQIEESLTAQGQELEQILGAQGMNLTALRKEIEIQKIVEKIAGKEIEVTDEEVEEYLEKNKDFLSEETDKEQIKEQLRQQKLNEVIQSWLKSLRDKAKINYFLSF